MRTATLLRRAADQVAERAGPGAADAVEVQEELQRRPHPPTIASENVCMVLKNVFSFKLYASSKNLI